MAKPTEEEIRDVAERIYRIRLERDGRGNVNRMLEKDADGGKKLRGRAKFYHSMVEDVLEVIGYDQPVVLTAEPVWPDWRKPS